MKILFVSAILPYPLYSGGQVRIYNLLKKLSANHQITLLTYLRNQNEREYISELGFLHQISFVLRGKRYNPKYLLKSIIKKQSLLVSSYDNPLMKKMIQDELRKSKYDLLHLEPFYVASGLPDTIDLPICLSEHNAEYDVYEKFASKFNFPLRNILSLEAELIKSAEKEAIYKSKAVTVVSDRDRMLLQKIVPDKNFRQIPNGVDTQYFKMQAYKKAVGPRILFVGNFSWVPNLDSLSRLLELWGIITNIYKGAKLTVAGKSLPQIFSARLNSHRNTEYLSNVSDIREVMGKSDMLLAPMTIGGGSKFKILESLAVGLPVLTSPQGAQGLKVKNMQELMIASSDREYLDGIAKILQGGAFIEGMIQKGRQAIEKYYSWDILAKDLEKVWQNCL